MSMDSGTGATSAREFLYAIADAITWLATTPVGLALLLAGLSALFLLRVWNVARERSLACAAAGKRFSGGEAAGLAFKELYSSVLAVAAAIPAIIAAVAIAVSLVAVADSLRGLDEMRANAERIRELSSVLRNLERRQRVMDVRVEAVEGGISRLVLSFFDPARPSGAAASQTVTLRGTDIYFDAIVCNFDYAEIAEGRRVNLAVPYRVFSDQVPQAAGVALGLRDVGGIPYQFGRPDDEIYGIAPEAFRARLAELVKAMDDDAAARGQGIVRSVYGSAVHRKVAAGDRFSVWVEQSGGLTVKDASSF